MPDQLTLLEVKELTAFPSGSAITYFEERLYLAGDDATEVVVLDTSLGEVERFQIFAGERGARIPKPVKADLESSAVITVGGKKQIWFLGSGSVSPHRDSVFALDPYQKTISPVLFDRFFHELDGQLRQTNIEAAAVVGDQLVVGARGNARHPDNYLLSVDPASGAILVKSKIRLSKQVGISGMDYDETEDRLFLTFSSEETASSYDDGEIGNSFLAILDNGASVLKGGETNIPDLIDLSSISPEFSKEKIEGVAYLRESNQLILLSDDDQGGTRIFRLQVQ